MKKKTAPLDPLRQPARLVITDGKGKVVQRWAGDVGQAAEIKKNLPPGLTAADADDDDGRLP